MVSTPDDKGPTLWAVNTLFIVLATLSVVGRAVARRLKKLPFGADDWLTCVALGWDWALYILFVQCRKNGLGIHQELVPEENVTEFRRLLYYFQIFYVVGPPTIKLSLLFLYRRIFSISPRFLYLIYAVGALVVVWLLVGLFLGIFDCVPIESFWLGGGKCISFKKFGIGYAIVNITTDFAVWLMPIPSAWKLRLPLGQKIAVSVIFGIGLFDCAAAFARLMTSMLVLGKKDVMFYYARAVMWSIVELSTGVVCTCLPTMRVVLRTILRGRAAWILGPSSPGDTTTEPHGQKYGTNRSWLGSNTYNEIECSSTAQGSTADSGARGRLREQDDEGEETEDSYGDTNNGQGGIQVIEEVTVELQPVKPVRAQEVT